MELSAVAATPTYAWASRTRSAVKSSSFEACRFTSPITSPVAIIGRHRYDPWSGTPSLHSQAVGAEASAIATAAPVRIPRQADGLARMGKRAGGVSAGPGL